MLVIYKYQHVACSFLQTSLCFDATTCVYEVIQQEYFEFVEPIIYTEKNNFAFAKTPFKSTNITMRMIKANVVLSLTLHVPYWTKTTPFYSTYDQFNSNHHQSSLIYEHIQMSAN